MGTSFEEIMKRMKSTPRVGVPAVTNPKLPSKVERDTAAAKVRQKAMPNFNFGTGNKVEQLVEHMKNAPHPTMTCPAPTFNKVNSASKVDLDAFDAQFNAFMAKMKAAKAKKKQEAEKGRLEQDETSSKT